MKTPEQIKEDMNLEECTRFSERMYAHVHASHSSNKITGPNPSINELVEAASQMLAEGLQTDPNNAVLYLHRLPDGSYHLGNLIGGYPWAAKA